MRQRTCAPTPCPTTNLIALAWLPCCTRRPLHDSGHCVDNDRLHRDHGPRTPRRLLHPGKSRQLRQQSGRTLEAVNAKRLLGRRRMRTTSAWQRTPAAASWRWSVRSSSPPRSSRPTPCATQSPGKHRHTARSSGREAVKAKRLSGAQLQPAGRLDERCGAPDGHRGSAGHRAATRDL